jgi:adenylate cyclase
MIEQSFVALRRPAADWNGAIKENASQKHDEFHHRCPLKRYFSPQIAEVVLTRPDEESLWESHRQDITVVVLDLRGFTSFADTSEPEEVMTLLRNYHAEMGKLIFEFQGTLERFTGDGIMIFFNDPIPCEQHTEKAMRMALEMRERAKELRIGWLKKGYDLDLGIGVSAGYATVGNIGFEGRMDYGAVGKVTNLAYRLCDEARGGQILTNEKTLSRIEALVQAEPLEKLQLKGFLRPVTAFNIRGLRHVPANICIEGAEKDAD